MAEYRRLLCPCGCGQLAEVSQAIGNDEGFTASVVRCHARTAIVKESTRRDKTEAAEALLYRVDLKEDVDAG